ncbi:MAG: cell division protein ZapA [Candidatus Sumerlaeaceae bacterium]|nr:cell division protein ZapA [Candidatus Sumerlaeaceae bacterium]
MSDQSANIVTVELDIYGQHFVVRAPAHERERLEQAARYVDRVIRQLFEAGSSRDTGRLAIQAALMIGVELFKLKDDIHAEVGLTEEVKRRVNIIIEKLDHTLRKL